MALTFADTHNMIAFLTKSNASKGFDQIIDFLNASLIKYALTVNPNIYVSVIKQFWSSVAIKKVNDVPRLQTLVDRKKVIITEATIRDALRLNDAEDIDCLSNEEIFTELTRMGYEKPSTLVRNVDSSTKIYMYPRFLQLMIRAQVDDLSSHSTKYSSPALTQKVFANMRRVGNGFSGVDTPLFEGMIVAQQVGEAAVEVNVDDVSTVGVADEGAASVADDDVPTTVDEPSIPSPTSPTQPPSQEQDLPSTSQVQPTPPQSSQVQPPSPQQPQPSQDAKISMDLLHYMLDTCTTLTRRVENLEQDKIAQALEITKLKQRVKKIERRNKLKVSKLIRLKKEVDVDAEIEESADVQGRQAESQAQIYQIDIEHADKVLSMQDDEIEPAELQEVVEVVTTAKLITEVVTAASATITATDATPTVAALTLTTTPRKGIMLHEPKPIKKKTQIEQDETYARELEAELNKNIDWDEVIDQVKRKEKEENVVMRYQALKRKPQTEAQARKNMMMYLRNMAGFKMDYFKGMTYDDIRSIFEKKFNSNVAFLMKTKEQMKEEDSRALKIKVESLEDKAAKKHKLDEEVEERRKHLQIVPNDDDDVYTEAIPLDLKVPVVDYEIHTENNKPYYKIKRADGTHQQYLSFFSMLRNFDREDLEVLWELVKEIFASSKLKNFLDDFLLTTLGAMFEKPDIQAQI
uniref:Xylulose kinase-1 n=1 Tax=Tanacetum cinerariifolium TaxID=118510 RepID=A0A6L2K5X3_TANCI|nr:xylulose kinase-1 [Tanacetum cinerariifolium]